MTHLFRLAISSGPEQPRSVASFADYRVARNSALRRLRVNMAERQTRYTRVSAGPKVVFEATRIEDTEGNFVRIVIDNEVMP